MEAPNHRGDNTQAGCLLSFSSYVTETLANAPHCHSPAERGNKKCQVMQRCLVANKQADGSSVRDISGSAALVGSNGLFLMKCFVQSVKPTRLPGAARYNRGAPMWEETQSRSKIQKVRGQLFLPVQVERKYQTCQER